MIRDYALRLVPLVPVLLFGMGTRECTPDQPPGSCNVDGVVYEDGDRDIPAPDGCNTCFCEAGTLSCTERACPPTGMACEVDGTTYPDGTNGIPAPDGCNTCTCIDGDLACTRIACDPGAACEVGGVSYPHGSSGVPAGDGCNTCACDDGVVTACTEADCSETCSVYGVEYSGSAPASDGCNTCGCEDGSVGGACTRIGCGPIPIEECSNWSEFEDDPYDLGPIAIEGDTLSVEVSYSGGCEQHYFRLCYESSFLESDPVQANIRLEHDNQNDACEAYPTEIRQFDLRPLADAWRSAYGGEHGTVILRIGDSPRYVF
jgi:hypothetical protein